MQGRKQSYDKVSTPKNPWVHLTPQASLGTLRVDPPGIPPTTAGGAGGATRPRGANALVFPRLWGDSGTTHQCPVATALAS